MNNLSRNRDPQDHDQAADRVDTERMNLADESLEISKKPKTEKKISKEKKSKGKKESKKSDSMASVNPFAILLTIVFKAVVFLM
jgi:hypothetical protein